MQAAFKEWAVICEALGAGLQSVIIRKGGIAEGKAGFAFRHDEFLLFPTWFHEQLEKTTLPPDTVVPDEPGEELEVRYTATIEWSGLLSDWRRVSRLRALHVLRDSVVEERYRYRETFMWPLSEFTGLIRPFACGTRRGMVAAVPGSIFPKSRAEFWFR